MYDPIHDLEIAHFQSKDCFDIPCDYYGEVIKGTNIKHGKGKEID